MRSGGLWADFKGSDVPDRELRLCPVSLPFLSGGPSSGDLTPFLQGGGAPRRSSLEVRGAALGWLSHSLPRQRAPQSSNDLEAVFLPRVTATQGESLHFLGGVCFFLPSLRSFQVSKLRICRKASLRRQNRCSHFTESWRPNKRNDFSKVSG